MNGAEIKRDLHNQKVSLSGGGLWHEVFAGHQIYAKGNPADRR